MVERPPNPVAVALAFAMRDAKRRRVDEANAAEMSAFRRSLAELLAIAAERKARR